MLKVLAPAVVEALNRAGEAGADAVQTGIMTILKQADPVNAEGGRRDESLDPDGMRRPLRPDCTSMTNRGTLRVVRQHLDDAAFRDPAVAAGTDHSGQLVLQRRKLPDTPLDLGQVTPRDQVDLGARAVRV